MASMKEMVNQLIGPNGLVVLPDTMKRIKWKGSGHEEEYLTHLLHQMEQWSNKMFPRVKFDDFIEKAEMVSGKKPVKTFVTKMRYGMPLNVIDPNMKINLEVDLSDSEDKLGDNLTYLNEPKTVNSFPTADWDALFASNSNEMTDLCDVQNGEQQLTKDNLEILAIPGPSGVDTSSIIAAEKMQNLNVTPINQDDDDDDDGDDDQGMIGACQKRDKHLRISESDDEDMANDLLDHSSLVKKSNSDHQDCTRSENGEQLEGKKDENREERI